MRQTVSQETHPLFCLEIDRFETGFGSVDEILSFFRERIEESPFARFIAIFDHYGHTKSLPIGQVDQGILAAKNILFCFGICLTDPLALAVRPNSIGVAETRKGFLVTFLEAPMPIANSAMEEWARALGDSHELDDGSRPIAGPAAAADPRLMGS